METEFSAINANIFSVKTILDAFKKNVYVSSVIETENGYSIAFSDGSVAVITDGIDGENGADAPVIGVVAANTDEIYYWILTKDGNTSWLSDASGNKIRVIGEN